MPLLLLRCKTTVRNGLTDLPSDASDQRLATAAADDGNAAVQSSLATRR